MLELIPSAWMREHLKKQNWEPTDWERASMIWHHPEITRQERFEALRELAENTENALLKKQIEERMMYEEEVLHKMQDNAQGQYIYTVCDKDGYSICHFTDYEAARQYGMKTAVYWNEETFKIEKHCLLRQRLWLIILIMRVKKMRRKSLRQRRLMRSYVIVKV